MEHHKKTENASFCRDDPYNAPEKKRLFSYLKKRLSNWGLKPLIMVWIIPAFIISGIIAVLFNYIMAKENARNRIYDHIIKRRTDITFIAHLPSLRMYLVDIRLDLEEEASFLKKDIQIYLENYMKNLQLSSYQTLSIVSIKGKELIRMENGKVAPEFFDFSGTPYFEKLSASETHKNFSLPSYPDPVSQESLVTDVFPIYNEISGKQIGGVIYEYQIPVRQFMDNARKVLVFNIVWNAGGIAVALIIIYVILEIIIKPLKYVTETAREMVAGDMSQKISIKGWGEAKVLATTFEAMRQRLKRHIEQLQENTRKLETIIEFLPDATFIVDKDKKVVFWNKAMEKMTGCPRTEMIGKGGMQYAFPFYGKNRFILIDIAFEKGLKGISQNYNHKYVSIKGHGDILKGSAWCPTVKGENRLLSATASALYDERGNIWGAIESIRDTTEKYKAEEEIRKLNEELEQRVIERTAQLESVNHQLEESIKNVQKLARDAEAANISKSEFLANMSHEIRTPMNGIMGTCDLLFSTNPNRKQREYLNIIRTSARSLLGLINDILDFSKIEAGKLTFERVPFFIRDVVEEVCDIFFEKISEKDTELIVNIASDVPKQIIADPFRLRQVLVNLTSNAFKFTDKGEICISIRNRFAASSRYQPLSQKDGSDTETIELLFSVQDTGIGIAPEIKDKLFDAFIQADGSISRKYGGTGLGLAICKKIVKLMDGKIWVESTPGTGSCFYFTAKVRRTYTEPAHKSVVPNELKNLKVLLVEDNSAARVVIQQFLKSFGCRTETAESAEEALVMYEKSIDGEHFGLILIDFKLPGMDGIAASEKIKQNARIKAPPIIIISGYIRKKDIQRAGEVGIESYLTKPIKQSLLFETILEIFGYPSVSSRKTDRDIISPEEFSGVSVLLVEDHPINRRVATEILEASGILVDTAVNGLEATEAVRKKNYDAIFMDVQMPEMNGIEATKIIRNWETRNSKLETRNSKLETRNSKLETRNSKLGTRNSELETRNSELGTRNSELGTRNSKFETQSQFPVSSFKFQTQSQFPVSSFKFQTQSQFPVSSFKFQTQSQSQVSSFKFQTPIIAMTAHAMSGDRERCLKAGMNDYVSKPIDRKELFAALRRNLQIKDEARETQGKENSSFKLQASSFKLPKLPGLNTGEGLERMGGSWGLYADILKDFCNFQKHFASEFFELIENKDFKAAKIKAHALKGAAGNVSAIKLRIAAKVLENACATNDKDHIRTLLVPVEDALSEVTESFKKMYILLRTEDDGPKSVEAKTDQQEPDPEISQAHLPELFKKLDKTLQKSDPVESEFCLRKIKACVSSEGFKAELDDLEHQISAYNFDNAIRILSKIRHQG
ncbi:response regulator [Desulfonema magnum]|uniref:Sensory/regulatory protein RpfC n=1 Tax=Desulfonema magnum TaxID=45655 RepID=A0A975GNE8_9BACT|nr:response regulator [Desulfonema magnum]QTA87687.1 Two component system response regulator/histidine kinase, PAS and HAMP domains-containing [Desulfonema magnum]